jgi:hypothetical protein
VAGWVGPSLRASGLGTPLPLPCSPGRLHGRSPHRGHSVASGCEPRDGRWDRTRLSLGSRTAGMAGWRALDSLSWRVKGTPTKHGELGRKPLLEHTRASDGGRSGFAWALRPSAPRRGDRVARRQPWRVGDTCLCPAELLSHRDQALCLCPHVPQLLCRLQSTGLHAHLPRSPDLLLLNVPPGIGDQALLRLAGQAQGQTRWPQVTSPLLHPEGPERKQVTNMGAPSRASVGCGHHIAS